jgi:hypothetical protein
MFPNRRRLMIVRMGAERCRIANAATGGTMYRLLSVSVLVIALLAGYSMREPRVSAQSTYLALPYTAGDTVRLEYADGQTRANCEIAQFYGTFVTCKVSSSTFVAPDAPPKIVYNLSSVISISLVKKSDLPR